MTAAAPNAGGACTGLTSDVHANTPGRLPAFFCIALLHLSQLLLTALEHVQHLQCNDNSSRGVQCGHSSNHSACAVPQQHMQIQSACVCLHWLLTSAPIGCNDTNQATNVCNIASTYLIGDCNLFCCCLKLFQCCSCTHFPMLHAALQDFAAGMRSHGMLVLIFIFTRYKLSWRL